MMRFVYFIQAGRSIKIGLATNVKARMAELQTGNHEELQLLGFIPGDRCLERQLHRRFSEFRIRGEWFSDCDAIRGFIYSSSAEDFHPKNNVVYFPIGTEVIFQNQAGIVVDLSLKLYDYEVGYDVLLWSDVNNGKRYARYNIGYDRLTLLDGRDHDLSVAYTVSPDDHYWRRTALKKSKLKRVRQGKDMLVEHICYEYACPLIDPRRNAGNVKKIEPRLDSYRSFLPETGNL